METRSDFRQHSDIPALHCSHTHNFRLLLCHFFFGNKLLLGFLIVPWEMGVSKELFNEFRTVQIIFRFPCVIRTVNKNNEPLMQHALKKKKKRANMYNYATSHLLSEAFPFQKVLHSSIKDSAPNYFFYHKLLDNCLLSLPLFGSLLLSHSATEKKQTNDSLYYFIWIHTFISLLLRYSQNMAVPFKQWSPPLIVALHLLFLSGAQLTTPSVPNATR